MSPPAGSPYLEGWSHVAWEGSRWKRHSWRGMGYGRPMGSRPAGFLVVAAALAAAPLPFVIGGCPSGKLCYAVVPFSGQASSFEERYAIGVCL